MPHILGGSTRLAQFGPLHFLSIGTTFGGSERAGAVSRVWVGPATAGLDVFAEAEATAFSALQGPDGGTTGGITADAANSILEHTGDVADDKKGCGIASCTLGHMGEVRGDEKTDGVPGLVCCEPDGIPSIAGPSNPSIQPRK